MRLLKGSVRRSYLPVVDIDWDAGFEPDKFFLPPQAISLHGTRRWNRMTRAERIKLSKCELVNIISVGIWFENVLNQSLLRTLMHTDPTSSESLYSLNEIGDETRHMSMFAKIIDETGERPIRLPLVQRWLANGLPLILKGPLLWVAALIGEEIFDAIQRELMDDPDLQPLVKRAMRIHVTEEARHIQFARDALRQRVRQLPWYARMITRQLNGIGGPVFMYLFTNSTMYRRAGLAPQRSRLAAFMNPSFRRTQQAAFLPLYTFLADIGLMGRFSRFLWRISKFVA